MCAAWMLAQQRPADLKNRDVMKPHFMRRPVTASRVSTYPNAPPINVMCYQQLAGATVVCAAG